MTGTPTGSVTWVVRRGDPPSGVARVPSDKSISHRAALLATLAQGRTVVDGFLFAEDTRASLRLARALGADLTVDEGAGRVLVDGPGLGSLAEPDDVIDCGNSGTTMRLGAGLACLTPGLTVLTGDDSLRSRPMRRVVEPLEAMGARIVARGSGTLPPLVVSGGPLVGATWHSKVASAQVKSAILLAGLGASGRTTVVEPSPSRDHTERLLRSFGAAVERDGLAVALDGGQPLRPTAIRVPGDLSSAAFPLAAAALVAGGDVAVESVGVNPTRTGFLDVLRAFGASVEVGVGVGVEGPTARLDATEEPVGRVRVRGAHPLRPVELSGDAVVRAIDEIPLLAVLATQAEGPTIVRDAAELRVKETDRIRTMADRLRALGARMDPTPDGFIIEGPTPLRGARVDSAGDHRVAMALAVAGLVAEGETVIESAEAADVSFPGFVSVLGALAPGCVTESRSGG